MKKISLLLLLVACSNSTPTAQQSFSIGGGFTFDAGSAEKDVEEDTQEPPDTTSIEDIQDIQEDIQQQDVSTDSQTDAIEQKDITAPEVKVVCVDEDGDGYGTNCSKGSDCDDANPNFTTYCPDCSKGNYPGCVCSGKSAPCYSADSSTKGVGQCKAGTQACKAGIWQQCIGEIDQPQKFATTLIMIVMAKLTRE